MNRPHKGPQTKTGNIAWVSFLCKIASKKETLVMETLVTGDTRHGDTRHRDTRHRDTRHGDESSEGNTRKYASWNNCQFGAPDLQVWSIPFIDSVRPLIRL